MADEKEVVIAAGNNDANNWPKPPVLNNPLLAYNTLKNTKTGQQYKRFNPIDVELQDIINSLRQTEESHKNLPIIWFSVRSVTSVLNAKPTEWTRGQPYLQFFTDAGPAAPVTLSAAAAANPAAPVTLSTAAAANPAAPVTLSATTAAGPAAAAAAAASNFTYLIFVNSKNNKNGEWQHLTQDHPNLIVLINSFFRSGVPPTNILFTCRSYPVGNIENFTCINDDITRNTYRSGGVWILQHEDHILRYSKNNNKGELFGTRWSDPEWICIKNPNELKRIRSYFYGENPLQDIIYAFYDEDSNKDVNTSYASKGLQANETSKILGLIKGEIKIAKEIRNIFELIYLFMNTIEININDINQNYNPFVRQVIDFCKDLLAGRLEYISTYFGFNGWQTIENKQPKEVPVFPKSGSTGTTKNLGTDSAKRAYLINEIMQNIITCLIENKVFITDDNGTFSLATRKKIYDMTTNKREQNAMARIAPRQLHSDNPVAAAQPQHLAAATTGPYGRVMNFDAIPVSIHNIAVDVTPATMTTNPRVTMQGNGIGRASRIPQIAATPTLRVQSVPHVTPNRPYINMLGPTELTTKTLPVGNLSNVNFRNSTEFLRLPAKPSSSMRLGSGAQPTIIESIGKFFRSNNGSSNDDNLNQGGRRPHKHKRTHKRAHRRTHKRTHKHAHKRTHRCAHKRKGTRRA